MSRRTNRKDRKTCRKHTDGLYLMLKKPDGTEYCPACELERQSNPPAVGFAPLSSPQVAL